MVHLQLVEQIPQHDCYSWVCVCAGDSYTVGFANTGGTTMCNKTACNPITKVCTPELDSQNNAISWGPLTAANFTADFQVTI